MWVGSYCDNQEAICTPTHPSDIVLMVESKQNPISMLMQSFQVWDSCYNGRETVPWLWKIIQGDKPTLNSVSV